MSDLKVITKGLTEFRTEVGELKKSVAEITKAMEKPNYGANTPGKIFATPIDHELAKKKGFSSHRDFLGAVMKAYTGGKGPDARLTPLMTKAAGSDEATGGNDRYGGFLVPVGFSPDFLKLDPEDDPTAGRTRMIPMGNPIVKIPARVDKNHTTSVAGGLRVYRRPETVASTSSRMEVEQISLEAHSLHGIAFATEEILNDSPQSFAALIADGFKDQFNYHMVNERLNGTGVGEYLGVNNSPALVSVAKEAGQAALSIISTNLYKMRSRCWGYKDAVWIANHDTMEQLLSLQSISGGGVAAYPLFYPSIREDAPDVLMGRPIYFTEYAQTLGTVGDIGLYNFKEYLEGVYQPLQTAESIHVRFSEHERAFKFWMRNAGTPWWRSALTPKNSTNTLSPFVVLATRA